MACGGRVSMYSTNTNSVSSQSLFGGGERKVVNTPPHARFRAVSIQSTVLADENLVKEDFVGAREMQREGFGF